MGGLKIHFQYCAFLSDLVMSSIAFIAEIMALFRGMKCRHRKAFQHRGSNDYVVVAALSEMTHNSAY